MNAWEEDGESGPLCDHCDHLLIWTMYGCDTGCEIVKCETCGCWEFGDLEFWGGELERLDSCRVPVVT